MSNFYRNNWSRNLVDVSPPEENLTLSIGGYQKVFTTFSLVSKSRATDTTSKYLLSM